VAYICADVGARTGGLRREGRADKPGPQDRGTDARSRQRQRCRLMGPAERRAGRHAEARGKASTRGAQMADGEGESARARELPLTGGAHLSGGAGARGALPGWVGLVLVEFDFLFFSEFLIAFLFIFSSELNSNLDTNQIQIIQTCTSNQRII
jgi:hypothetical protein